jgi:hypothetical protein
MAAFDSDKVIKGLDPKEVQAIKEWRREFCKPFDKGEVAKLIELSDAVDALWMQVIRERQRAANLTNQPIPVWGQEEPKEPLVNIPAQEKVAAELERYYTAYRRLKLAMDYWCALWFWPIPEAAKLPSRDEFLFDMELILKGTIQTPQPDAVLGQLFPGEPVNPEHVAFVGRFGMVNVDEMLAKNERLRIVDEVSKRVRFHHWELQFAEVFAGRGGFDLIVGNPPWVLVSFDEAGVLSEQDPLIAIRQMSATDVSKMREMLLTRPEGLSAFLSEFVVQTGIQAFLSSPGMHPHLQRMKTNLYKCFITRAWNIGSAEGVSGFLHPEGVYDDPNGGSLRIELFSRLKDHYQLANELSLFPEVFHKIRYSVNVYTCRPVAGNTFFHASNFFHPSTIDGGHTHDGAGTVPGIKNDDDQWDIRPHRSRLITVNRDRLSLFARLYDEPETRAEQARLPVVHSEEIVRVLEKFAAQPSKLGDLEGKFFATQHWNETNAQHDGTIRRETRYPKDLNEWIVSGPHFYVGTPFNKTPNESCSHNLDYSDIDLTAIPEDYLPRTNYIPACDEKEYLRRSPKWDGVPSHNYYRHINRQMVSPTGERTHVCAIIPPKAAHVLTAFSIAFADLNLLLLFSGLNTSLPYDFFVKCSGKQHVLLDLASQFPILNNRKTDSPIIHRTLRLNCLTCHYAPLWESVTGTPWHRSCGLRTERERRQTLVELDALAALALDLTEEELITIYRVQFPVLRQYERENLYDQTGRLVPKGVLDLARRHNIDIRLPLNVSSFSDPAELVGDVETPGLGVTGGIIWEDPKMEPRMKRVYPPPFTRCDREADMRQAYRAFRERVRSQEQAP